MHVGRSWSLKLQNNFMGIFRSKIDLHCHSNASDGALTPKEVVKRAIELGLTHLALTDHDTCRGINEAKEAAKGALNLIPGFEISATWNNNQIHIVGLFLDYESESFKAFTEGQKVLREQRALEIAQKLERVGFHDMLNKAKKAAGEGASITRGNYARLIVAEGKATCTDEAFNVYLRKGKKAYVATNWPDVSVCVEAIHKANGVAVLAHPKRYEMTNMKLRALMEYFKNAGGDAIEVSYSQQRPQEHSYLCELCARFGFKASLGSDFHALGTYRDLGLNLNIPEDLTPVWDCPQAQYYNFK